MVINMIDVKLRSIAQLQEFLDATQEISFTGTPGNSDSQRYEHISRVLKRFEYPGRSKGERGVVLAYLRRTSGYSRSQLTRLVGRWEANRLAQVTDHAGNNLLHWCALLDLYQEAATLL